MPRSHLRVLGLDPGLQVTGYAVLESNEAGIKVCEAGVIRSGHRNAADMAQRILTLYNGLCEVLDQWQPDSMAVEQLYAHYDHPRTAVLMAHARGAFFLAGAARNIPVLSYAATKVKKLVTGSGRAGKEQMQRAIAHELRLVKPPEPPDVADALAIALCHLFASGSSIAGKTRSVTLTGVNREALFKPDPDTLDSDDKR